MMFLQKFDTPQSPPATIAEAEERFLAILRVAAETPLQPSPRGQGAEAVKMVGQMNIAHTVAHGALAIAYTAIFGKPVPAGLELNTTGSVFGQTAKK